MSRRLRVLAGAVLLGCGSSEAVSTVPEYRIGRPKGPNASVQVPNPPKDGKVLLWMREFEGKSMTSSTILQLQGCEVRRPDWWVCLSADGLMKWTLYQETLELSEKYSSTRNTFRKVRR
jgi:hypothetical protein